MPHGLVALPPTAMSRRHLLGAGLGLAAAAAVPRPATAQSNIVNVYNWDTYIGEGTLDQFQEATGITVRYDLYASADELFGKLREGDPGYDVVFPSNEYLQRRIEAGMLEPLDHAQIPNLKSLDPSSADARFDPGRKHSKPYL